MKRLAMLAALEQILAEQGQDVCRSSWGKALGGGLFEFRVRHTAAEIRRLFGGDPPAQPGDHEGPPGKVVLRAFCHAHGDKVVLLLGGYDKGADPSTGDRDRAHPAEALPGGGATRAEEALKDAHGLAEQPLCAHSF